MVTHETVRRWLKRHQGKHFCLCGCGELIEVKKEHYRRGIPKYIKGHNFVGEHNPRTEGSPEVRRSTTWEILSDEEKERRLANLRQYGKLEEHPQWKGGRIVDEDGYIRVRVPNHPMAHAGYLLEHRYVMENFLRENYPGSPYLHFIGTELYLKPETVVHHVDEDKHNNDISNLFIFPDNAAHIFWHHSSLPDKEKIERIKSGIYRTYVKDNTYITPEKE